jgi:hypothetical protein
VASWSWWACLPPSQLSTTSPWCSSECRVIVQDAASCQLYLSAMCIALVCADCVGKLLLCLAAHGAVLTDCKQLCTRTHFDAVHGSGVQHHSG